MLPNRTPQRTGPKPKPTADRFWPKVQKSDGCWLWTAWRYPNGYGSFGLGGHSAGSTYAHRISWELHFGPIPEGMYVLHTCDVPACVRRDHLFLGSHQNNMDDMKAKGRHPTGEAKPNARMTEASVREVHRLYRDGMRQDDLAARFGVTRGCITDILRGKSWKHLAIAHPRRKPGRKSTST